MHVIRLCSPVAQETQYIENRENPMTKKICILADVFALLTTTAPARGAERERRGNGVIGGGGDGSGRCSLDRPILAVVAGLNHRLVLIEGILAFAGVAVDSFEVEALAALWI